MLNQGIPQGIPQDIAQYIPVPPTIAQLQSGEMHFFSFLLTETQKQFMGYKLLPTLDYLCHITDRRFILEPIQSLIHATVTTSLPQQLNQFMQPNASSYLRSEQYWFEIPNEAIKKLKVVRSGLTPYARVVLKQPAELNATDLVFAVTTTSPARKSQHKNGAKNFVQLGNEILGIDAPGAGLPFQVDLAEVNRFKNEIAASPIPVLVDFFAPGCQPCQKLAPLVNEVIEQYNGKVKLLKINIEENPSVPIHYGINCFPTLMLFHAGEVVEQITGIVPQILLARMLKKHLTPIESQLFSLNAKEL